MLNEQLSTWIDSESSGPDSARLLDSMLKQPSMQQSCATCWLIGDVLREELPIRSDFTSRVMAALEDEPAVISPVRSKPQSLPNHAWMRMAAAVTGAVVAAWAALNLWSAPAERLDSVARRAAPTAVAATSTSPDFSNDRTYLMAHQASSVGVPMAGVAQYIRTVGDDHVVGAR